MELNEIAPDVYACLQEDRGFGWNNSGYVNRGGGLIVDTFWDLPHTQRMIELCSHVGTMPPRRLVNTHHNGDHCWGNQLFKDIEIIAHRSCAEQLANDNPAMLAGILSAPELPLEMKWLFDDIRDFDFSGIEITLPNHIIDDRLDLDLDGHPCYIIHVGPAHTAGDLIVHLPEDGVVFGGDVLWNGCTPIGWEGTHGKWIEAIDLVLSWDPKIIVPGHGPLCGIEETKDLRAYLELVYSESRRHFDQGLSPLEAAKGINLGHYAEWTEPERLIWNVARAYREFRGEPWDAPLGDLMELLSHAYQLRLHWQGE